MHQFNTFEPRAAILQCVALVQQLYAHNLQWSRDVCWTQKGKSVVVERFFLNTKHSSEVMKDIVSIIGEVVVVVWYLKRTNKCITHMHWSNANLPQLFFLWIFRHSIIFFPQEYHLWTSAIFTCICVDYNLKAFFL